ncbi:PREDICTED: coadhesin-like [Acropora digitifera]|uniref:coadhesin-like n=1 Tax=Acropora digitifera TaxID=70779 RepID=UPI00077A0200|nr:PREDICTED: coadhesin-like [Acropora digitifera]
MMLSSEFCKLTLAIWMFVAVARLKSAAACTSLIANNGNVKFSASTSAVGPGFPHVNSNDVWCASVINDEQYLQVDLGFNLYMDYVIVQGMSHSNRSVSQYYLMTSTDNDNYEEILISGRNRRKAFYGPFFDGDIGASENLSTPIEARYVRFNPQEPMIQNENHLCMRVDILSCGNGMLPDI